MHLSHDKVGFKHRLHESMLQSGTSAYSALQMLPWLVTLTILIHHELLHPNAAAVVAALLKLYQIQYTGNRDFFLKCMLLDHAYHDISPEDEASWRASVPRMQRQNIRFDSWSEQECYDFTGFRKHQLIRIYMNFGIEQEAGIDGYIRVSNRNGQFHRFHPEEIFLFMMTKHRTGFSNKHLCDLIFGGWPSPWSHGWPWILHFLDEKYAHIIGHQGLARFLDKFPRFFNSIQNFIRQRTIHHFNDGTAEATSGLNFLPFVIFGFIDCTIFRICRPYSGPAGDFVGAPRNSRYYNAQRAVYTRFKKLHGVKIETVMLPNGISTVFGPTSARPNDVAGVLRMSNLDEFLFALQQGSRRIFSLFGDGIYNVAGLHCKCI